MVYWHVEKKNVCIYSQLKNCSSSEVAAMIEGLLRHRTDAEIESNAAAVDVPQLPTRHDGGSARADAEVVLNEAGRGVLAEPCGVEPAVLARALPAFTHVTGAPLPLDESVQMPAGMKRGCSRSVCDDRTEHPRDCTVREDRVRHEALLLYRMGVEDLHLPSAVAVG